jgi:hypothetical protein
MLRELAITLNHQLGNALVSLTTFRQSTPERPIPASLLSTVKGDVTVLEALNTDLALMQSLHEAQPNSTDIREVAHRVGQALDIRVETGAEPVILWGHRNLLDFAFLSLIRSVAESRSDSATNELTLRVKSTGSDADITALFALKGRNLELEGILPEPTEDSVPNHGRLNVFLAKEILRLHHGEIHAGPGLEGTEILISVRNW